MQDPNIQFWIDIDDKILDLIDLIRAKYPKFSGNPVEQVVVRLYDAYRASGKVADAIDSEIPMNMDDLNELWQWIDTLLGRCDN